jgi:hypothetical protein
VNEDYVIMSMKFEIMILPIYKWCAICDLMIEYELIDVRCVIWDYVHLDESLMRMIMRMRSLGPHMVYWGPLGRIPCVFALWEPPMIIEHSYDAYMEQVRLTMYMLRFWAYVRSMWDCPAYGHMFGACEITQAYAFLDMMSALI